uniref:Uncharacterized protein n=1 Tax=Medicago truncatula TaxID=3880 RepID=B7FG94_MEDTR|nr:unknown [Medicago truncatula]
MRFCFCFWIIRTMKNLILSFTIIIYHPKADLVISYAKKHAAFA